MATTAQEKAAPGQMSCPFLVSADAAWIYPVEGFCRGLPNGLLMIPTVEEYRTQCSTRGYTSCPIYRSRMGEDGLQPWFEAEYQSWALRPLEPARLRRGEGTVNR